MGWDWATEEKNDACIGFAGLATHTEEEITEALYNYNKLKGYRVVRSDYFIATLHAAEEIFLFATRPFPLLGGIASFQLRLSMVTMYISICIVE